jgi:DNA-binding SARP family transcriptional activator/tetratricopeptide (TPR) repeat protein
LADDSGRILTIHLLGGLRIMAGDEGVAGLHHARLQELLAYLLLQRGRPVSRQHLAFLFWPDSPEKQARTNLRNLWHRLRRTLPDAERFIDAGEATIQWRADAPYTLDAAGFEAALAQARDAADPLPHLEQAVALYGGELLPGSYHDWLLAERERLSQLYGRALQQLAALHEERRQYRRAIAHARSLLRHDPLHEPAYTHLMRLHALVDDRAAALHTYHTCATVLSRELGVEPGRATQALYEQLLQQAHAPPSAPAQPPAPPLVGRSAEWAQLQAAWREAAHRPRLALISGEAGIGKTRLAEALGEWVQRQGIAVLHARCYAAQGDLPYAPVVAWLRSQPLPPLADPTLRELARLLPEILEDHPALPPPGPLTEGWQRLHLFQALAQALLHRVSAVLLLLEDVQWCDRDTLDWLQHVLTARRGHEARPQVLVAATLRSEAREEGSPLAAWQAQLAHAGWLEEIELGPLSPESTLALANHVAAQPLDPALAAALFQGTEGNPLFIVEMARAGLGQAAPSSSVSRMGHAQAMLAASASLPARVRQVLEARLAQLSTDARAVIELAAVVGRDFSYSVLARASDLSEDLLVGCLDEGWRRRIIREQGEEDYDFSHDKLREVAYAGLSRTRRRWLHGRVAEALQAMHTDDLDLAAGAIAGHYEAAGRPSQAIDFYERAAASARAVYAHADALAALQKAIGLLPALPAGAERDGQAAQLYEALGDVQGWLAQPELARSAYAAALAAASQACAIDQARLRRKIGQTLAEGRAGYEETAGHYQAAGALLGPPAEGEAAAGWWQEWCQLQLAQLGLLYWYGRVEDAADLLAHVRPLIERHGTALQRASFFASLARQENRRGRFAPSTVALDYARAALAALPPSAAPAVRSAHQFGVGFNLLWLGDYAEAEAVLRDVLAMAEESGDVSLQVRCLAYLMVVHRRQGRVAETEAAARRCLAMADEVGMLVYVGASRAGLAWAAWQRHDLADVERRARQALATWQKYAGSYPLYWQALWPLIGVALAQGPIADAIPHARTLCAPEQQALPAALAEPLAAAWAAWDAGQPDDARQKLQSAVDLAQQMNFS